MQTLDLTKTNDPLGSGGVMGTAAKTLDQNMTKLIFKKRIATNVPKLAPALLKEYRDLKLLHDWCHAIANGGFETDDLQKYYEITPSPKMHNARWWTTYIRILSAFARLKNPTMPWIIMVTFILQAYAKNVFDIHFYPHITMGSVHYNEFLRNSELCLRPFKEDKWVVSFLKRNLKIHFPNSCKYCSKWFAREPTLKQHQKTHRNAEIRVTYLFEDFIFPVFTRFTNSCWGNPESVLLAAVASDDKTIAQRAFEIYVKSLELHEKREDIRRFVLKPEWINPMAENCFDMIKWEIMSENDITPPPLLMGLFDVEHIRKIVYGTGKLEFPNFPSHSQANERAIKQTTLSAKFNRTHDQQLANILSAKKSREDFPLNSKKDDFVRKS